MIQLITLRQLKCSYLSNFHHQPGDFFRTGLLWHSTAADGILQGGDSTVLSPPCSIPSAAVLCHNKPALKKSPGYTVLSPPCSIPSAAVLCHNKPVLKKSPGWWWKFDKYEHFNCLSVINCIIINFYQTNEPLQASCSLLFSCHKVFWCYLQTLFDNDVILRQSIDSYLIHLNYTVEHISNRFNLHSCHWKKVVMRISPFMGQIYG